MRFLTLKDFVTHHTNLSARLLEYLDAPRSNYVQISGSARQALEPRHDYWLSAASPAARIHFAQAIDHVLDMWAERLPKPLHFITFVSPRFAFCERDARNFDLAAHQREIISLLARRSFIGMTEPAYYPRWRIAPGGDIGPVVVWHSHTISMGVVRSELEADLRGATREESLLPNSSAVHIKAMGREQAKSKLWYSSKMPHRTYVPYTLKRPKEHINRKTGEVIVRTHGHRKDDMRTGVLAKVVDLLNGHYLDELMFGNGMGRQLADAINDEARQQLDAEERRERDRHRR